MSRRFSVSNPLPALSACATPGAQQATSGAATVPLPLASLRFAANHNAGLPTNPDYQIQPQINTSAGFVNVGSPLTMNAANNGATHVVDLAATSGHVFGVAGGHRVSRQHQLRARILRYG